MKPVRTISRRSFFAAVGGASGLALAGCVTRPIDEHPYDPPAEPRNVPNGDYGRAPPCFDGDSGITPIRRVTAAIAAPATAAAVIDGQAWFILLGHELTCATRGAA